MTMNYINLNIIVEDNEDGQSPVTITIIDSVFSYGHVCVPLYSNSSAIMLKSNQKTFFAEIKWINTTLHHNLDCDSCDSNNIYIELNGCTTSMLIESHSSTSTHAIRNESRHHSCQNKGFYLRLNYYLDSDCDFRTPFIMNNVYFKENGVHIETLDQYTLILSNIVIESAHNALEIEMSDRWLPGIISVILKNVTLQDNYGYGCVFLYTKLLLQDFFLLQ